MTDFSDGDVLLEASATDEVATGFALEEAPTNGAAPPSSIVVPARGRVLNEDGLATVSIIRPCVSRGRRIRGMPPIYTQEMLGRHAGVFKGWPMFLDHVTPELAEAVKKRGRSVRELGGRVVESWYDPTFTMEEDEEFGYQEGAVMGWVLPQEVIEKVIVKDPDALHVSINAFPTGARVGTAFGQQGALIEGIRKTPPGSVDWVIRGGAGGRVVSVVEDAYSARPMSRFDNMTPDQLREELEKDAPQLLEGLVSSGTPAPTPAPALAPPEPVEPLSEERISELAEERASEMIEEREYARALSGVAHRAIDDTNLPPRWRADLKLRYSVHPSGPGEALLVEATDDKTAEEVLVEAVNADITHARELYSDTLSPTVRGQGGRASAAASGGDDTGRKAWRESAVEMGLAESADEADELLGVEA